MKIITVITFVALTCVIFLISNKDIYATTCDGTGTCTAGLDCSIHTGCGSCSQSAAYYCGPIADSTPCNPNGSCRPECDSGFHPSVSGESVNCTSTCVACANSQNCTIDAAPAPTSTPTSVPPPGTDHCDSACGTCGWRDSSNGCHNGEMHGTWCCHRECNGCGSYACVEKYDGTIANSCNKDSDGVTTDCPCGTPSPTPTGTSISPSPTPTGTPVSCPIPTVSTPETSCGINGKNNCAILKWGVNGTADSFKLRVDQYLGLNNPLTLSNSNPALTGTYEGVICSPNPHYLCLNNIPASTREMIVRVTPGYSYSYWVHANKNNTSCDELASAPTFPIPTCKLPTPVCTCTTNPLDPTKANATINWTPVEGATHYWLRVDYQDGVWDGATRCPILESDPSLDICLNDVTSIPYSFNAIPGKNYTYWIHTCGRDLCTYPIKSQCTDDYTLKPPDPVTGKRDPYTCNCPAAVAPNIDSLKITKCDLSNSNNCITEGFTSSSRVSGLQSTEDGVNWYNPIFIKLNVTPVPSSTGYNNYVAFYTGTKWTTSSSFVNYALQKANSYEGFLLMYNSTGVSSVWDPTLNTWKIITNLGSSGWDIPSTNPVYRVYPVGPNTWKVRFYQNFGSKIFNTAAYAVDNNSKTDFEADLTPQ